LFQLYGTPGWRKPRRFQTLVMMSFPTWCVSSQATCPALSSYCQALRLKPARYYRSAGLLVFDQTIHRHITHILAICAVVNFLFLFRGYFLIPDGGSVSSLFYLPPFISYQPFPLLSMSSNAWLNHSVLFTCADNCNHFSSNYILRHFSSSFFWNLISNAVFFVLLRTSQKCRL
jgi:hypothetical protein